MALQLRVTVLTLFYWKKKRCGTKVPIVFCFLSSHFYGFFKNSHSTLIVLFVSANSWISACIRRLVVTLWNCQVNVTKDREIWNLISAKSALRFSNRESSPLQRSQNSIPWPQSYAKVHEAPVLKCFIWVLSGKWISQVSELKIFKIPAGKILLTF